MFANFQYTVPVVQFYTSRKWPSLLFCKICFNVSIFLIPWQLQSWEDILWLYSWLHFLLNSYYVGFYFWKKKIKIFLLWFTARFHIEYWIMSIARNLIKKINMYMRLTLTIWCTGSEISVRILFFLLTNIPPASPNCFL